jgi:hypothetical protein
VVERVKDAVADCFVDAMDSVLRPDCGFSDTTKPGRLTGALNYVKASLTPPSAAERQAETKAQQIAALAEETGFLRAMQGMSPFVINHLTGLLVAHPHPDEDFYRQVLRDTVRWGDALTNQKRFGEKWDFYVMTLPDLYRHCQTREQWQAALAVLEGLSALSHAKDPVLDRSILPSWPAKEVSEVVSKLVSHQLPIWSVLVPLTQTPQARGVRLGLFLYQMLTREPAISPVRLAATGQWLTRFPAEERAVLLTSQQAHLMWQLDLSVPMSDEDWLALHQAEWDRPAPLEGPRETAVQQLARVVSRLAERQTETAELDPVAVFALEVEAPAPPSASASN